MAYQIDLTGKVALVTGGSSGLGVQFAQSLAKAGATVVIAARRIERLQEVAKDIQASGGKVFCVALDVLSQTSIDSAV
ncbi:MAG: SDR family NAD(P)-dependent oxidoreductase, partial [Betaproteobacteria bacterium]